MNEPPTILETVLYAENLDQAEAFYEGILGLEKVHRDPKRQVFFRCGNSMLLIFNPVETRRPYASGKLAIPSHGAEGEGHVCFRATHDEIDAWRSRLEEAGVEIESDFEWPGGGRSLYFRDPSGNSVEFAEPRIWELS